MPLDSRRNQGPESAVPYRLYAPPKSKDSSSTKEDFLKNGIRKDGRKWDQNRKIYLKTSVVSQAKGSAYIEQNKTKVICSVFDPREIPRKSDYSVNGELYCEFKYAPFSCISRRGHQQDSEEKEFSLILRRALEPAVCRHEFPNFQVDVYALVLQDDGSALSAAITCASLALADAGVPMYDLVASATLGIHENIRLLDPTAEEIMLCNSPPQTFKNHGIIIFSYLSSHQQISEFAQFGFMDLDCISNAIDILTSACDDIYPLSQQCLVKSVTKILKKKKKEEEIAAERKENEAASVEALPVEALPVEALPVEASHVEASHVEASHVEASHVEASPVEASPVEASPVEASPIEGPPAEAPAVESPVVEAAV